MNRKATFTSLGLGVVWFVLIEIIMINHQEPIWGLFSLICIAAMSGLAAMYYVRDQKIILLMHFQKAGHNPIALVGGATGMVGDPSGKSDERNLLDEATLNKNVAGVKSQLERFLKFGNDVENAAELVNNYDWMKDISLIDFVRDVGKHITVNYMMAKDSVKKRLDADSQSGMSFTEFTYQLFQGYDFYHLFKEKNCVLQMGGSDQWGNITTGTELIRRIGGGKGYAITCPLITKSDGSKFGKSEGGNVWLDPNKTSPFKFYQFYI